MRIKCNTFQSVALFRIFFIVLKNITNGVTIIGKAATCLQGSTIVYFPKNNTFSQSVTLSF